MAPTPHGDGWSPVGPVSAVASAEATPSNNPQQEGRSCFWSGGYQQRSPDLQVASAEPSDEGKREEERHEEKGASAKPSAQHPNKRKEKEEESESTHVVQQNDDGVLDGEHHRSVVGLVARKSEGAAPPTWTCWCAQLNPTKSLELDESYSELIM
jgi:hypothetical protein